MLDFRIETFLCVCRCMNFTRAAEELEVTQPAVSQQIRFLEKHYKTKLFCYEGKKLRLTNAGELLKNAASVMVRDELLLQKKMLSSGEGEREIRFGATETAADTVMSQVLSRYLMRYPEVQMHMEVEDTGHLLRGLDSGTLDFAVTEEYFPKSEYDYLTYEKLRLIAVCGMEYPLKKKTYTLEELTGERLLVSEGDSGMRNALEHYLASQNRSLHEFSKIMEIGSFQTIRELTKSGCGITFLYETSVLPELRNRELREIVLKDFQVTHDLTFIWRKGSIYANLYRELFQQFSGQSKE